MEVTSHNTENLILEKETVDHKPKYFKIFINMVAYLISFVFIGYIAYLAVPGSSLFSWHPFLMTLGFVGFMFQAMLVFSKESSLFISFKLKTKIRLHWIFNTLGVVCVLVGYYCIYENKEQNGKHHLTSWHGLIGFLTIGYAVLQWCVGHFLTLFIEKIRRFIPYSQLQFYHSFSGLCLFMSGAASLILGLFSNWFKSMNSGFLQYLCSVCILLLVLMVVNQLGAKYVFKKPPTRKGLLSN